MRLKGKIIFWAAVITLPLALFSGDLSGVLLSGLIMLFAVFYACLASLIR